MKVNLIMMDKHNHMFHEGANFFAPFGQASNGRLAEQLAFYGDDKIKVQYNTHGDDKSRARDKAKYSRRLDLLKDDWHIGPWRPQVIRGDDGIDYVMNDKIECELTRKVAIDAGT